ncbi:(2Fe-2S)-binding protein [bacterium]|nr:(2Fe-2S)-binding protein [bacterium]
MKEDSPELIVQLVVNDRPYRVVVAPQTTLLQLIRDHLGLTGTKEGCGKGQCGACTVLMDGQPVNSCLILAVQAQGHRIVTIEGLEQDGELDPVQQAFIDEGAVQCGFCTPGMVLSARALLDRLPHPDEGQIKEAISGHLCRCTGYSAILRAIRRAGEGNKPRK